MPELGFVAFILALSYGSGVMWSKMLGTGSNGWMRTAAAPFVGVLVGEGIWAEYFVSGPEFFGLHIALALVTTFVAVLVDVSLLRICGSIVRPILSAVQLEPEND